ncbi:MAG: hypothetical protein ABIG60_02155 [Patescibacteria group bacterium]
MKVKKVIFPSIVLMGMAGVFYSFILFNSNFNKTTDNLKISERGGKKSEVIIELTKKDKVQLPEKPKARVSIVLDFRQKPLNGEGK